MAVGAESIYTFWVQTLIAVSFLQCFCKPGFFGVNCERISSLKEKKINETAVFEEILLNGNNFKFMWRYVGGQNNEVEVVLVAKTLSYVALGWRPSDVTKSCKKFPSDALNPLDKQFHPMDCQDIVIGMVKGDLSNVGDYYTRDRYLFFCSQLFPLTGATRVWEVV